MVNNIESIFKSITPDNIQDIPVISDAIDVFIATLNDLSKESIDINDAFKNKSIREELVKVYLDDLYRAIKEIQYNEKIANKVNKINSIYRNNTSIEEAYNPNSDEYDYLIREKILKPIDYFNEEHFLSFKAFKQKKGTLAGIRYIYDLIGSFVTPYELKSPLDIKIGDPFHLDLEGYLPAEFYEYLVYPLAHPLGFTYTYSRVLKWKLIDYFPCERFIYTIRSLEVRCLNSAGDTFITDFSDRTVTKIDTYFEGTKRIREVYFKEDDAGYYEFLKQETTALGQSKVNLYDNNGNIVQEFSHKHCSIYMDYDKEFDPCTDDVMETTIIPEPLADFVDEIEDYQDQTTLEIDIPGINTYKQHFVLDKTGLYDDGSGKTLADNDVMQPFKNEIDSKLLYIGGLYSDGTKKKISPTLTIGVIKVQEDYYIDVPVDGDPVNLQYNTDEEMSAYYEIDLIDKLNASENLPNNVKVKISSDDSDKKLKIGENIKIGGVDPNNDEFKPGENPAVFWNDELDIDVYRGDTLLTDGNRSALD